MTAIERLRLIVASAILIVWFGAVVFDATHATYDIPDALNYAALLVAGFLFGPSLVKARKDGNDA